MQRLTWRNERTHKEILSLKLQRACSIKHKLFCSFNLANEMMIAVEFAKEFGFRTVIVGAEYRSKNVTYYLKQNNIVVGSEPKCITSHHGHDDIDMFARLPYQSQQAGVNYCITDFDPSNGGRNLMFNVGSPLGTD